MTILLWKECSTFLSTDDSVLQRAEVRLIWAETAEAVVPMVAEHRPDLVVLAPQMGQVDGFACARDIADAAGSTTAVLVVGGANDEERAEAVGVLGVIAKPLTRERLVEAVRRHRPISERESERAEVAIKVQYSAAGVEGLAYTRDLSTGGCFLHSHEPLPMGATLGLEFQLPGPGGRDVRVDAEVVRVQSQSAHPRGTQGVAVRFTGLAAGDRVEIGRFLRSRTSSVA